MSYDVPEYDADVVYTTPLVAGPFLTFGPPCPFGVWFDLDWDWHDHFIDRGVRWDRNWHHADLGRAAHWEHDRSRPIPVPAHSFVPPRGDDHRGWNQAGRGSGVFNPNVVRAPRSSAPPIGPPAGRQSGRGAVTPHSVPPL